MVLKPKLGVGEDPLYKEGFRCFSRSPCRTKGVTTTCIHKVRDGKVTTYPGRFTTGDRRLHHVTGSSIMSREAFHRVCAAKFRVTVGRNGSGSVVSSCGRMGKVCTGRGGRVLRRVLMSR